MIPIELFEKKGQPPIITSEKGHFLGKNRLVMGNLKK